MQVVKGSQLIAFEWSMTAVTLFLVSLRIYSRGFSSKLRLLSNHTRRLRLSDFFVILAWLSFVAQATMDTVLYTRGFFSPQYSNFDLLTLGDPVMMKLYFIETGTYLLAMYCVKAAMLCLYHEFFPKLRILSKSRSWVALCIVDVIVLGCYLSGQLSMFITCLPVWRNWSLNPDLFCSPSYKPSIAWYWGSHVATDIFIYLLPISVIRGMNLSQQDKYGMTVIFALGFLCILFAVGTIASSYKISYFSDQWIFTVFEQSWAITIVCLPPIRSLIVARNVHPHNLGSDSCNAGNSAEAAANGSYVATATYGYSTYGTDAGKVLVESSKKEVKNENARGRAREGSSGAVTPVTDDIRLASCGASVFSECSASRETKEADTAVEAGAISESRSSPNGNQRWWRSIKTVLEKGRGGPSSNNV